MSYRMSLIALASLLVPVVMASSQSLPPKIRYDVANARPLFEDFIKEHKREYKNDADKELHFEAFVKNLEKINAMNDKSATAVFGINKFADYTKEEFSSMNGIIAKKIENDDSLEN